MKIIFIGSVEFSKMALQQVLACSEAEVVGVITKKASPFNADFCSLEETANQHKIPCLPLDTHPSEGIVEWIRIKKPDVIYCFGWSNLLPKEILSIPRLGVVGYHPAALPQNRGRHPIIWTLALGLKSTASTFFFMDEGADSGDILSQIPILVEPDEDAGTLYRKLSEIAAIQIKEFTKDLSLGTYRRIPQDHDKANYWRKRGKRDGEIDWRMSSQAIHNLVKALTRPYVGAHCSHEGEDVKIWKTEVVDENDCVNFEPGKVLKMDSNSIVIKCGEGAIRILEHEFTTMPREGCYL